jgi:hypothetical protein
MRRYRHAQAAAVAALALTAVAGCSSGPASPTAMAASILSQAGATSSGQPYVVGTSQGTGLACDNGSAEADGTFQGGEQIAVCVLPDDAVFSNDEATAAELAELLKGKGKTNPSPAIEVKGKLALIYLGYPDKGTPAVTAQQVAQRVGGTNLG